MDSITAVLLEKHKDKICDLFRQAIKYHMLRWDTEGEIEMLIDHELNASVVITDLATQYDDTTEVDTLSEKDILEIIKDNLAQPALNPPSRDS